MPIRRPNLCRPLLALAAAALALGALPQPAAAQTKVIRAARMLDVRSGQMVPNPVVVVENGRITAIGPRELPRGAEVIDLGERTLLPGLIDTHVHLTGEIDENFDRAVKDLPAMEAFYAAANAHKTLMAGFTTVRNVGSAYFTDVALDHAIQEGVVVGPRIVAAGHSLGITGGHCDVTGYVPGVLERDWRTGVADGEVEAMKAVRYQIKHGADVIKICATAGVLSFEGPVGAQQFSEEEMRAIVEEAARHDVRVAAHAHGTEGIKAAVRAGVASIEHGSILDDEAIALMKQRGTYLVPTLHLSEVIPLDQLPPPIRAKAEFVLPRMRESFARALRGGVPIAFGTDAAVIPHGTNAREFQTMVDLGMRPLDAIRAATLNAADLLGRPDLGVIEPGALADLIAVAGNPVEDVGVLTEVGWVMKGGEVVKD